MPDFIEDEEPYPPAAWGAHAAPWQNAPVREGRPTAGWTLVPRGEQRHSLAMCTGSEGALPLPWAPAPAGLKSVPREEPHSSLALCAGAGVPPLT